MRMREEIEFLKSENRRLTQMLELSQKQVGNLVRKIESISGPCTWKKTSTTGGEAITDGIY
jgi:hypothetical protein